MNDARAPTRRRALVRLGRVLPGVPWPTVCLLAVILAGATAACEPASAGPEPGQAWPSAAACEGLDAWPEAFAEHEAAALARIDARRAEGADCGERGKWGPAPALRRRTALDCAARAHALDMAERGYFGRLDPDGRSEADRVEAAGYAAAVLVQHLAAGPRDAEALVERTWGPRPVPCSSMADPALTEVGLGYFGDADVPPTTEAASDDGAFATYWVLLLAHPEFD
jgi:uncharacterized protein YkwD